MKNNNANNRLYYNPKTKELFVGMPYHIPTNLLVKQKRVTAMPVFGNPKDRPIFATFENNERKQLNDTELLEFLKLPKSTKIIRHQAEDRAGAIDNLPSELKRAFNWQ